MMSMKSHPRIPAGKLAILLATGCLLLALAGCGGRVKSAASTPVPTTVPNQAPTTQTAAGTATPPATRSQQPANQTAADNQEIVFTHSYSPGHSYRITLPGYWRGKYTVKESKGPGVEDMVAFYFYKPVYVTARPGSDQKVAAGCETIFGIYTKTESQWEEEKQLEGYGNELASRDGLVFVLVPSISNEYSNGYQDSEAALYEKMANDAWSKIGRTFQFVDGN